MLQIKTEIRLKELEQAVKENDPTLDRLELIIDGNDLPDKDYPSLINLEENDLRRLSNIFKYLADNTHIKSVDIHYTCSGPGYLGMDPSDLLESLEKKMENGTLEYLRLSRLSYSAKFIEKLSNAITTTTSLKSLLLSDNYQDTSKNLIEALKSNWTLSILELKGITDELAIFLSEVLETHPSLTQVCLHDSELCDEALSALYKAVETNKNLHLEIMPDAYVHLPLLILSFAENLILDLEEAKNRLKQMETLIPALTEPKESSKDELQAAQVHRLLTGLLHMNSPGEGPKDALACLITPFSTMEFNKIATIALRELLSLHIMSIFESAPTRLKLHLCKWAWSFMYMDIENPSTADRVFSMLSALRNNDSPGEVSKLRSTTVLTNLPMLKEIAKAAYQEIAPSNHYVNFEMHLLSSVLEFRFYQPLLLDRLFQSPEFLKQFTNKYPGKTHLVVMEACCCMSEAEIETCIRPLPKIDPVKVFESTYEDMKHYNRKHSTLDLIAFLPQLEAIKTEITMKYMESSLPSSPPLQAPSSGLGLFSNGSAVDPNGENKDKGDTIKIDGP